MAHHFSNLTVFKLDADPKKYFATWIADRPNTMLVAGAKGRSCLRELFHKSFVQDMVTSHTIPVFIAHAR